MGYYRVPTCVNTEIINANNHNWSPSMYRDIIIPTHKITPIRDLLDTKIPFDKGVEPGSLYYLQSSPNYLLRTKALQHHSNLIYPKGDAVVPVNPKVFVDQGLADGDILMSKDSNVGACAIVDGTDWACCMFSGGIVRLRPTIDRYYLFSFIKHPLFIDQLIALSPRGATITHAKSLWLDCLIPFPNQKDGDKVIDYVSRMTRIIIDKEKAIRMRNIQIDSLIHEEIENNQRPGHSFKYSYPMITDIERLNRYDACIYSERFLSRLFKIANYSGGCCDYKELGFSIGRGQNLQISCIGRSIYSTEPRENFYRLAAPTDFTEYRTIREFRYLGNKKCLIEIKKGDVVFGAEGFCKGRVVVIVDDVYKTITNIHGIIFHPQDGDATKGIFLGCYLGYLRSKGIVDAIGAGGSGGSLAVGYFHLVPIPQFPASLRVKIAALYSSPSGKITEKLTLQNMVEVHQIRNDSLGIWALDQEMKSLIRELRDLQEQIINGCAVNIPI